MSEKTGKAVATSYDLNPVVSNQPLTYHVLDRVALCTLTSEQLVLKRYTTLLSASRLVDLMSQSGPPHVAASPPDQLQLPARPSEEKSPSRGWTHQELLPLIQDDSRHDELDQLLSRLSAAERGELFDHLFQQELNPVGDVVMCTERYDLP